jgi:hypothetical protein
MNDKTQRMPRPRVLKQPGSNDSSRRPFALEAVVEPADISRSPCKRKPAVPNLDACCEPLVEPPASEPHKPCRSDGHDEVFQVVTLQ